MRPATKAITWASKLDIQVMLRGKKTLKTLFGQQRPSFLTILPKPPSFHAESQERLNALWKKEFTRSLRPLLEILRFK